MPNSWFKFYFLLKAMYKKTLNLSPLLSSLYLKILVTKLKKILILLILCNFLMFCERVFFACFWFNQPRHRQSSTTDNLRIIVLRNSSQSFSHCVFTKDDNENWQQVSLSFNQPSLASARSELRLRGPSLPRYNLIRRQAIMSYRQYPLPWELSSILYTMPCDFEHRNSTWDHRLVLFDSSR